MREVVDPGTSIGAAPGGVWFSRRVTPYRSNDDGVEGVVVTFTDISERVRTSAALERARENADHANLAKTRFLAAASHDLRQPLQTLMLIEGLLKKSVQDEKTRLLVARLQQSLAAMSGMLNTLLDINQIEAGTIQARTSTFPVQCLLDGLRDEFADLAASRELSMRFVPSSLTIVSDQHLIGQMLRNLVTNALKYTRRGRILVGCRRRRGTVAIEVWDTGIGIPEGELHSIFEEYHQVDNPARDRGLGLGLGLAIVRRLGHLMGLRVTVRSRVGKGSVFGIEGLPVADEPVADAGAAVIPGRKIRSTRRTARILVIEDDADLRDLLEVVLAEEGHHVATAASGAQAIEAVTRQGLRPDLILADYNLPNGMTGVETATRIRSHLRRPIPALVLTGDVSLATLREIERQGCRKLNKPIDAGQMTQEIQSLLATTQAQPTGSSPGDGASAAPVVYIVDDDAHLLDGLRRVIEDNGRSVKTFPTAEAFLDAYRPGTGACILIDAYLPGMSGLDLMKRLHRSADPLPAIMITGQREISLAIDAMRAGAIDFIQKPVGAGELLASIERATEKSDDANRAETERKAAAERLAGLTIRRWAVHAGELSVPGLCRVSARSALGQTFHFAVADGRETSGPTGGWRGVVVITPRKRTDPPVIAPSEPVILTGPRPRRVSRQSAPCSHRQRRRDD